MKLYKSHTKNKENKQPNKKKEEAAQPAAQPRKKNFFERKRFVDYPKPEDSEEDEAKKETKVEEIVSERLK